MTDIATTQNTTSIAPIEAGLRIIINRIMELEESSYSTSKEKYERKANLIEEDKDMTTNEKLLAMDRNYDHHNKEVWQGIIAFGIISFVVTDIVSGNPIILDGVRRLIAQVSFLKQASISRQYDSQVP